MKKKQLNLKQPAAEDVILFVFPKKKCLFAFHLNFCMKCLLFLKKKKNAFENVFFARILNGALRVNISDCYLAGNDIFYLTFFPSKKIRQITISTYFGVIKSNQHAMRD